MEKKEFHQPLFIYIPILPKLSATSKRLSNCLGCKTSGSSNCLICKCQPNSFYLPLYGSEKFINVPCEGFKQYHQVIFSSVKMFHVKVSNTTMWRSQTQYHQIIFSTELLFIKKYTKTIMVSIVVAMLCQVHISPLGSLSQVCLVQDTWQMANFMYTQLRINPLMLYL